MKKINESGFTFIEMMISMVISSLVIAGVYGVYRIQQRSYTVQDQVAEMQQRLRFAMDALPRKIRMAGHNPEDEEACKGNKRIVTADNNKFVFNSCNFIGKDDYRITVDFDPATKILSLTEDKGMDGTGQPATLAEDVDSFEMAYNITNGIITAVTISMLVRSTFPDPKHIDTNLYPTASGGTWTAPSAERNYHRRLLISTIKLRNML